MEVARRYRPDRSVGAICEMTNQHGVAERSQRRQEPVESAPIGNSVGTGRGSQAHNRLLDAVKSIAIVRVVIWHTWSWAWLSWIPAMPAMFFSNGALLDMSLSRRGWRSTVAQRARRLLIPFWVYAVACWTVMILDGWHPSVFDAFAWVLPLSDPRGSDSMPGLWVPLWYIRAYVWFVLGSGILKRIENRLGMWIVIGSGALSVVAWGLAYAGHSVPFAVSDAFGYLPFVAAGMVYNSRGRLGGQRVLAALAISFITLGLITWWRFGPTDGVVNRSYLLMLLVGAAGIAIAVVCQRQIENAVSTRHALSRTVSSLNSRALTIYLWQGFGLVAADRLVQQRIVNPVLSAVLSLIVVVTAIVGATVVFGRLEDLAARRISLIELIPLRFGDSGRKGAAGSDSGILEQGNVATHSRVARLCRLVPAVSLPILMTIVLLQPVNDARPTNIPLSGQAVAGRAAIVQEQIGSADSRASSGSGVRGSRRVGTVESDGDSTAPSSQLVLDNWLKDQSALVGEIDLRYVDAVVVDSSGEMSRATWGDVPGDDDPLLWWSMTKAMTTTWMMRLAETGVLSPKDRLDRWVPEAPNAKLITLDQLARHSSGIPSSVDLPILEANPKADLDRYRRSPRLAFTPGSGFNYSRTGYHLLTLALERASGTTWTEAMRSLADTAGATISFDEDHYPHDEVTDPDRHGYRGSLWGSGGIVSSTAEAAKLIRWVFTEGLAPSSVDQMTRFSSDPDRWFYGLGLVPTCPCTQNGDYIESSRFGLDSATGSFAVDRTGTVVVLRPSNWFRGPEPIREFLTLEGQLLDAATTR